MKRVDLLIAAVLVAAAAGSAAGLILWDPDAPNTYDISYSETSQSLAVGDDQRSGPGSIDFQTTLDTVNMTHVVVQVSAGATGVRVQESSILVTVTAPDGSTHRGEATLPAGQGVSVPVEVPVHLADLPARHEVKAADASAALDGAVTGEAGMGEWNVTVQFGAAAPVSQLDNALRTAQVTFDVHTFESKAALHVPEGGR